LVEDNEQVSIDNVSGVRDESRTTLGMRWVDIGQPICLVLLVSIPVMIVEEEWHGRPMIDDGTHLWLLPAFLVASAFLLGGVLAGFRCPRRALVHAGAVAGVALAVLLLGAILRRVWIVHEGTQDAVLLLWAFGAAGTLTLSLVGSLFGRRWAAKRR
jgi:hypothetical protein